MSVGAPKAHTQITEPKLGCEKRMLTNEEALRLIKECEECFVVWATDQNAFVAVHPIPKEEDTLKAVTTKVEAMAAMKTDYKGPTKGLSIVIILSLFIFIHLQASTVNS